MIHIDRSDRSIVVWCSSCPSFRRLASSPGEAESEAIAHLTRAHDESKAQRQAITASRARQRRSDTP